MENNSFPFCDIGDGLAFCGNSQIDEAKCSNCKGNLEVRE